MTAFLVEAGAQSSQSPMETQWERGDAFHIETICRIARRLVIFVLSDQSKGL